MIGSLHPGEASRHNTSSSDLWMLGFGIYSMGISRLNWKSTADASIARESAWLFSDLRTCMKLQQENLDFQAVTIFRYEAI